MTDCDMNFKNCDQWAVALALYHWLQHNWKGQSDELYKSFCILTSPGMYRPSSSEQYFSALERIENLEAKEMYCLLKRSNFRAALKRVTA